MDELISVFIPGRPVPKERPRFAGSKKEAVHRTRMSAKKYREFVISKRGVRIFTPKKTADYEDWVAWNIKAAYNKDVLKNDIGLAITFYYSDNKIADIDNLTKGVLDGLQKSGMIENDRQVKDIHAKIIVNKHRKEGVSLTVYKLERSSNGEAGNP